MPVLTGLGPYIHLVILPIFMLQKHRHSAGEAERRTALEQTELEPGGKTVLFSANYTCAQRVFIFVIGRVIEIVSCIIAVLELLNIDLRSFWFPMPFFEFWKAKKQIAHYRILGASLRLNASQADAYFLFLSEALGNFYTCAKTSAPQIVKQHNCILTDLRACSIEVEQIWNLQSELQQRRKLPRMD